MVCCFRGWGYPHIEENAGRLRREGRSVKWRGITIILTGISGFISIR